MAFSSTAQPEHTYPSCSSRMVSVTQEGTMLLVAYVPPYLFLT